MKMRLLAIGLALMFAGLGDPAWADPVIVDEFDDGVQNTALWTVHTSGSGVETSESGGRLRIDFDVAAADGPDGAFYGGYRSTCKATGDFDIQVDFDLLDSPPANGTRLALVLQTPDPITIERASYGTGDYPRGEYYVTNFGYWNTYRSTTDRTGSLRLVRSGGTAVAYIGTADGWLEIRRGPVTAQDANLYVMSWSHNWAFSNAAVHNSFDNFRMNAGRLVACTGTALSAAPALVELAPGPGVHTTLRATLTDPLGAPISGRPVEFSVAADGLRTVLCPAAITDDAGVASCGALLEQAAAARAGGYEATFAGGTGLGPSSDTAPLVAAAGYELP